MHLIPWVTIVIAAVVAISPLGREVIHNLSSGERLSANIASAFLMVVVLVLLAVAAVEIAMRALIRWRRTAGRAENR